MILCLKSSKNLFSKKFKNTKISNPIPNKDDLIKSKEFTNDLYDTINLNFGGYAQKIRSYAEETYPNYQKFLFGFLTNPMENLAKKRNEILHWSEYTFLAILSNYQQELTKCKRQSQKTKLSKDFDKNSKVIIKEAETILEKEFQKEFDNLKNGRRKFEK